MPISHYEVSELEGGIRFQAGQANDANVPQRAIGSPQEIQSNSIVKNYPNRPPIKVKTLTYSGKQINHLSNELGGRFGTFNPPKSYMTASPTKVLNDLNSGNFQVIGRGLRGNIIVRFNYIIGNSYNKFGEFLGPTKSAVLHLNGSGEVHLVPWIPK